ncbi:alpha-1,4-N-acetylglucosaminyltransferase-like [Engystomops pustulosus]|uniref:alpha-1,4-N-acetylglucosaminyltransferase-like n=1 Tax=Engystomops pustulosus TaxID=76066 RepID=UPI003AFB05F3
MLKSLKIVAFLLLVITLGFFYGFACRQNIIPYIFYISEGKLFNGFILMNKGFYPIQGWSNSTEASSVKDNPLLETTIAPPSTTVTPAIRSVSEVLKQGNGIIFLETSDRLQLPPLVLCAVESAARVYKDRPVAFFMKGLNDTNTEELVKRHFPTLSFFRNVYFFPLKLKELFIGTPLHSWYKKINPEVEKYWVHVSADGCRIALIWKYGGLYMDTDIISMRTIPKQNFIAAQSSQYSSNGVFGFSPHHDFTQECMEDFVQNYNSGIWGHQGPYLFTRVLKKFCSETKYNDTEDAMCGNITIFKPERFYPISYPSWRRYYQVWDILPTFHNSFALHLWNYMSRGNVTVVPGSNVLAEHLYKDYCPSTYKAMLISTKSHH